MSDNPVAIITGGSRGVGAATAKILSSNGWNVLITCSSSIKAAEILAAECTSKTAEVIAIKADVANDGDCILTVEEAINKWGRVDAQQNWHGCPLPGAGSWPAGSLLRGFCGKRGHAYDHAPAVAGRSRNRYT